MTSNRVAEPIVNWKITSTIKENFCLTKKKGGYAYE